MAIDLGTLPLVTFVTDENTPDNLEQYAGIRLLLGPGISVPPMGTHDTLIINGVHVPGYIREAVGGYEWVMQPAVSPVVEALEAVPGTDGWALPAAKATFSNIGGALLARGVTLVEARQALIQLYQAAVANYVAANPD